MNLMLIKIAGIALVLAAAFFSGYHISSNAWEAKLGRVRAAAQKRVDTLQQKNDTLIAKEASHEQTTQVKYVDRIKRIYTTLPAAMCLNAPGLHFADDWNATSSAAGIPAAAVPAAGGQPAAKAQHQ